MCARLRFGPFVLLPVVMLCSAAGCSHHQQDGCERLYEQRRRCQAVYHEKAQFVQRCQRAGMPPGLVTQIRCARKSSCAAFRACLKAAGQGPGTGHTPPLYRRLRPAPRSARPPGMRR